MWERNMISCTSYILCICCLLHPTII